jgi:hypothetical protein
MTQKGYFPNNLLLSNVVSADINQVDLSAKLMKFISVQWLRQNVPHLLFALDELRQFTMDSRTR